MSNHDDYAGREKSGKEAEAFFERVVREHGQPGVHTVQNLNNPSLFLPAIVKELGQFKDHTGRANRLRWVPDFILANHREHVVSLVDVKWHDPMYADTGLIDAGALHTYRLVEKFFNVPVVIVMANPEERTLTAIRAHDAFTTRKDPKVKIQVVVDQRDVAMDETGKPDVTVTMDTSGGSGRGYVLIPVGGELWKCGIYLDPEWREKLGDKTP
ncbi:MAG: hypothetical protein LAN83_00920 [Acidobacteriia bacterium]|nr:hypothetical protein [Terriglobia bacterium]